MYTHYLESRLSPRAVFKCLADNVSKSSVQILYVLFELGIIINKILQSDII